ncbi:hypothetical protein ACVJBD_000719 [Rhizobium mongolense]
MRQGVKAGLARRAALGGEPGLRLAVSITLQRYVLRLVEVVDNRCGGQHAAAHDVERRMHAGQDAALAHFAGARQHFLKALRHKIGHGECIAPGFRRMPARETTVFGRIGALGRLQRREDHHVPGPAVGTRIFEIAFGRLR